MKSIQLGDDATETVGVKPQDEAINGECVDCESVSFLSDEMKLEIIWILLVKNNFVISFLRIWHKLIKTFMVTHEMISITVETLSITLVIPT